jgi:hypothetical protein
MSKLITIKVTNDKTGELVKEFNIAGERRAEKVYAGLLTQMNQDEFTAEWIEELNKVKV